MRIQISLPAKLWDFYLRWFLPFLRFAIHKKKPVKVKKFNFHHFLKCIRSCKSLSAKQYNNKQCLIAFLLTYWFTDLHIFVCLFVCLFVHQTKKKLLDILFCAKQNTALRFASKSCPICLINEYFFFFYFFI